MFVRTLALACCLISVAYAQTPEERIVSALGTLRSENNVFLQLQGSQSFGGGPMVALDTRAYWTTDTTVVPNEIKLDVRQYRDDKLVARIVGDGKTLWAYNNLTFKYSATPYGRWGQTPNANYRKDLIDAMGEASSAEMALMVRLLRQIFAGDASTFSSWLPGATVGDGEDDPNDVVYTLGDPVLRQVTFDIDTPDSGVFRLEGVEYLDKKPLMGETRESGYRISVLDVGQVTSDMNFTPQSAADLAGWKQVTRPRAALQ
jgi:hypothetical protein